MPSELDEAHKVIRLLAQTCLDLKHRLEEELKHRYGPRSEKRGRGKPDGSGGEGTGKTGSGPGSSTAGDGSQVSGTSGALPGSPGEDPPKKPGHGRRPIPSNLPRTEVLIPPNEERCLRCGGPVHHVERVESYRYDYEPATLRVIVYVRWRDACDDASCDAPFRIPQLPTEPIPKGRVTAGFLAHLLVNKFADHCPLYRFRKILLRQGADLPLSTLVDYCKKATEIVKPLWDLMRREVLSSEILRTDDTYVLVRLPGKKGVLKGHLWAYKGDEAHPYVVFDFSPNWEGKTPQTFLTTFKGYIQADAYKGYDALFKPDSGRFRVGCMAHARRKWVAAQASAPRVAAQALAFIGQLYAIEQTCKELPAQERKSIRQAMAAPILNAFHAWMEAQRSSALPKSPIGVAIEYALNQWAALTLYLADGRLDIDNNAIERELRAIALGRKNWMAAGSEVGGETAALGFTMIASALANGVNPAEWLKDVLERIPTCPPERLNELLPDRWKAARNAAQTADHAQEPQPSENAQCAPLSGSSTPAVPAGARSEPPSSGTPAGQRDGTGPANRKDCAGGGPPSEGDPHSPGEPTSRPSAQPNGDRSLPNLGSRSGEKGSRPARAPP